MPQQMPLCEWLPDESLAQIEILITKIQINACMKQMMEKNKIGDTE